MEFQNVINKTPQIYLGLFSECRNLNCKRMILRIQDNDHELNKMLYCIGSRFPFLLRFDILFHKKDVYCRVLFR